MQQHLHSTSHSKFTSSYYAQNFGFCFGCRSATFSALILAAMMKSFSVNPPAHKHQACARQKFPPWLCKEIRMVDIYAHR